MEQNDQQAQQRQTLIEIIRERRASGVSLDHIVKELNEQYGVSYDYAKHVVTEIASEEGSRSQQLIGQRLIDIFASIIMGISFSLIISLAPFCLLCGGCLFVTFPDNTDHTDYTLFTSAELRNAGLAMIRIGAYLAFAAMIGLILWWLIRNRQRGRVDQRE